MNPNALVFWSFCSGVGYLLTEETQGAVTGLVVGLGISLLVELLSQGK